MRLLTLLFILVLSSCTAPQFVGRVVTSEDELPVRRAFFAESPAPLSRAFRSACRAPGDVYRNLGNGTVQCQFPPTPDLAAFLLLTFDGALEIPLLIMQKQTRAEGEGVLVEMSYFAEVIQKSGNARRIYFRQPRLDDLVDSMLVSAGGETR